MSEEEIIEIIEKLQCEYKEQQNDKKYNDYTVFKAKEYSKGLQGLLDLYNKEKLNSLNLSEQLNKEKEKNIQDMIKDFECSNFIKNNYIHKNKIETLLQDVDNTKFINKHFKGMYLYNNLKCLLEE